MKVWTYKFSNRLSYCLFVEVLPRLVKKKKTSAEMFIHGLKLEAAQLLITEAILSNLLQVTCTYNRILPSNKKQLSIYAMT